MSLYLSSSTQDLDPVDGSGRGCYNQFLIHFFHLRGANMGLSFHWVAHFMTSQKDVLDNVATSTSPSHGALTRLERKIEGTMKILGRLSLKLLFSIVVFLQS